MILVGTLLHKTDPVLFEQAGTQHGPKVRDQQLSLVLYILMRVAQTFHFYQNLWRYCSRVIERFLDLGFRARCRGRTEQPPKIAESCHIVINVSVR